MLGRIPILDVSPQQPGDHWPAKAFADEVVPFAATIFREGHDLLGADLVVKPPRGAEQVRRMRLISPGLDRWSILHRLDRPGLWTWWIRAYADDWATWVHAAQIKVPAGIDVELTLTAGALLLERAAAEAERTAAERGLLADAAVALRDTDTEPPTRLRLATTASSDVTQALDARPIRSLITDSPARPLRVERTRAGRGSWYEFFPRSEGAVHHEDGSWTSGTFRTAARRLPAVAAMGFDVVYIPPVHPIGRTNRKGPNNSLVAGEHDPGSPYGIGSAEGGHDAIHPDLGTEADFAFFLDTAARLNLEVALDIALQASPDHPWVTEHPEFFTTLPDGSIAYAENPPKKYQDIYPLNFDNDPVGSYAEMLRIFTVWIDRGVRIFRVDNPHTKPLGFWERLLHDVNGAHPDVIFLAEAFTRPPMMQGLAKVGFQQSYTYFTWRNTKQELTEYLVELATLSADYLRPNFFVNTHDILTPYLQFGGEAAYKIRAAIAATASPTWGVYSGYELLENVARSGAEENIDNEKYEFRPRDWALAASLGRTLAPYLTRLNEIRRLHPALGQLRNIHFHWTEEESVLAFSKHIDGDFTVTGEPDTIVVVANLDPHGARETVVHLDLTAIGREPGQVFQAHDLITDAVWTWGSDDYVRLDPFVEPVHILHIRP
ncbi:alpha-1,4-glucan--maltose-1-phosphate maltosyltransferase [uncultured Amnibacterium sp.]|uniref:alpha-1,4-glucan--maltose-1-phosphate maltosyltransferase n=1 Tax=uncultured Amnibacterium sp. TaxID=1631851 RepID=UPI0035CB895A